MKKIIIIILILLLTGCSNNSYDEELNVLNWSSYIPSSVISNFEEEYNIKVNYSTYSSNEELLAKIVSSKEGTYDLIFPSDYMVEIMISSDLIDKIDKTKISNYSKINKIFLNQEYDKYNDYSLPFLITTTVIAVNSNNINDNISSYNDLLNSEYKNNIVLLDDQRITIGMALKALGYDMNETDINKLNEAKDWLLKIKSNVKAFDSDSPKTFLITNEVDIGVMWNAEAVLAKENNDNIKIIYPSEGGALSIDNYVILKKAKNTDNAYLFINYLLRDDVSKMIIDTYPYISSNKNIQNISDYEIKSIMKNSDYIENVGANISLYDKLWADIK